MIKSSIKSLPQISSRFSTRSLSTTSSILSKMQNEHGQGVSHAQGDSKVPGKVQEQVPKGVEESLPNAVHDTGNSDSTTKSHATGHSYVPEAVQKAVPKGVEEALPDAIHDTSKK